MTQLQTILFDLDDTLLHTQTDLFIEQYFGLLHQFVPAQFDRKKVFEAIQLATQVMIKDSNANTSNYTVFWQAFTAHCGIEAEQIEPTFISFYEDVFPQLQVITQKRPFAPQLINFCFQQGWQVVIATNPVFPIRAIEHRLAWAGTAVDQYDFALVTSYENMNSTKPHPSYYQQILNRVKATPQTTLMVGNSWQEDIIPANSVGLHTYWICEENETPPDPPSVVGSGTLANLYHQLEAGTLF